MIPTVLSIAGLDPSGGAGIAADLKTATMMGAYGMAALTTVTVQHPSAVERVSPLEPELVAAQVQELLQNMPIGAIKIGLVGTNETAQALIGILEDTQIPIVLDPVTQSSSGQSMSTVDQTTFQRLLIQATLLTPNRDELAAIFGTETPQEWVDLNQTAVLCTGGHGPPGPIQCVLWQPQAPQRTWMHKRVQSSQTHGTGCTLSTAIATQLAKGHGLEEAIETAIKFTHELVTRSSQSKLVPNNGPLLHFKMNG